MTVGSERDRIPALIMGTGLTVLGTLRCLAAAGVDAYCLSEGAGFEAASRWCRGARVRVGEEGGVRALARALESLAIERAVIFSCSDYWTPRVAELPRGLSERFLFCAPSAGILEQFVDKGAFGRLLAETGVPHPLTVPVTGEAELAALLERLPAGVFLKPTDSLAFLREFRVKAFRVAAVDDAVERYRLARAAGVDLLLQEYIPGPPDRHYFVDGFVDGAHRVTAAFARRRLRMHPPDFGNSSCLISEPIEAMAPALESLRKLFAFVRYRGIFSAEFKRDERDGVYRLIEVNCRPWWYVEFAARCGVNVVDYAYRDALGLAPPRARRYRSGVRLVHAYYDFYACRRLRRDGVMSLGEWAWSWMASQKPVFRIDDPAPAFVKLWSRIRGRVRAGNA